MAGRVYLDYNATAPLRPEASVAMTDAMSETGNPSSVHHYGRRTRQAIEAARRLIAASFDVGEFDITFTSGATESLNSLIVGWPAPVLVGATEHDAVRAARPDARTIAVDGRGLIDLESLSQLLSELPSGTLVAIMAANNETGVVQPLAEIAGVVAAAGGFLLCDCVQAAGRLPANTWAPHADFLVMSAHKLGGPAGVGALMSRKGLPIIPFIRGGGQEHGRRAGTENRIGIIGFGAACEAAAAELPEMAKVAARRDAFEAAILAGTDHAVIHGQSTERLPNTSAIAMPGVGAETQIMSFDLDGFAVSSGAACSSGKVARSHVLTAMGVDPSIAEATIRVSIGSDTREEDLAAFAECWLRLYQRLGERAAA